MKAKVFSILAMMLCMAQGATAQTEESEIITTTGSGPVYTGEHFKITASLVGDDDGLILHNPTESGTATIEAIDGKVITKVEIHVTYGGRKSTMTTATKGDLVATNSDEIVDDYTITISNVNSASVEIGTTITDNATYFQMDKFKIYYTDAPGTYTVTMKEGTEDADKWTAEPNPAAEGQAVTVTYSGTKKVKSVKAKKKATGAVAYKECPDDSHPHWIDLGLTSGTHWQCCNVGADAPEGYGSYYSYDDA